MIKQDKFSWVIKIHETLTYKKLIQKLNKTCATARFEIRLTHQERRVKVLAVQGKIQKILAII